jgi:hypothetical protein
MVTKWVFHNGELHELLLRTSYLCADCRFLQCGQCKLFGIPAGLRPAICVASEGEARARRAKTEHRSDVETWSAGVGDVADSLRGALDALAKRGEQR